ncbi:unnamed protein product [Pedinophyceae sp. YPF-701]|nr:unnamed protein product [Pedinophyceae sp. YPF-701]
MAGVAAYTQDATAAGAGIAASALCGLKMGVRGRRKLLVGALLGVGSSAVVLGLVIRSYSSKKDRSSRREDSSSGEKRVSKRGRKRDKTSSKALQSFVFRLYRSSWPRLAVLFGLAGCRTYLSNRLARLQGYLFRAAYLRNVPLFARNLIENACLCLVSALLESSVRTWSTRLELVWRRSLTEGLHRGYFDNMTYYRMTHVDKRVDSPEQRVCEDVPKFCSQLADLTSENMFALVDAAFYVYSLRAYAGTHKYTLAMVGYIFGAGALTTVVSPPFGALYKKLQLLEGQHRSLHHRLNANVESVAFLKGIAKESLHVKGKFDQVTRHVSRVLDLQLRFGIIQDFLLKYLGATVAVVLILGPFFSGPLRPQANTASRGNMLSMMRYHTSVVISLFQSLGTLAASSSKVMRLGAFTERIVEMEKVVRDLSQPRTATPGRAIAAPEPQTDEDIEGLLAKPEGEYEDAPNEISFENAMVVTPGRAVLVKGLSLRVPLGTNLLVTGPNGAGKSSLFRVLGGLWPLARGKIRKPGGSVSGGLAEDIFYVPQRPYVTLGTLEEQIIYPKRRGEVKLDTKEVTSLLDLVDLEGLVTGDWQTKERDWGAELSLGEQQRLGMARLFYHRPRFAILDECTSGVTNDMEQRFCDLVREIGCSCITISHRPALMAFHDVVLHLDGEGGWSVHHGMRPGSTVEPADAAGDEDADADKKVRQGDSDAVLAGMTAGLKSPPGVQRLQSFDEAKRVHSLPDVAAAGKVRRASGLTRNDDSLMQLSGMQDDWTTHQGVHKVTSSEGLHLLEELLITAPEPNEEAERELSKKAIEASRPFTKPRSALKRFGVLLDILVPNTMAGSVQLQRLGLLVGVVLARTFVSDRTAQLNGRTVYYVLHQDLSGFLRLVRASVIQSAASAVLAQSLKYLTDKLALAWRRRLVEDLSRSYFAGNTLYITSRMMGLPDAEARATRDVERVCTELAALIPTMIKPTVDICWFSLSMWRLTGRRGLLILYAYMAAGYTALRIVTPDFQGIKAKEASLEGAFRAVHSRLRSHAESVAFFGGGRKEGSTITAHFRDLIAHLRRSSVVRWGYGVADDFFSRQLPHNVTWLLTLLFALDQPDDYSLDLDRQGELVHNMRYLATVVAQNFVAFGELLSLNRRFAEISGSVERVVDLRDLLTAAGQRDAAMQAALLSRDGEDDEATGDEITLDGLSILAPSGHLLARELTLLVRRGDSLLVTGPNGSGKTSVFRVLAGLWPIIGGRLRLPRGGNELVPSVAFVPQRPYTTVGTLREQLVYPLSVAEALKLESEDCPDKLAALDEKLRELMRDVRLAYLLDRYSWTHEQEWSETLSLGEQQRMGMARLFFHKPKFAVLDECTNATSVDIEECLYQRAQELGVTMVTITQRTALVKYHTTELRLVDGAGDWELRHVQETD